MWLLLAIALPLTRTLVHRLALAAGRRDPATRTARTLHQADSAVTAISGGQPAAQQNANRPSPGRQRMRTAAAAGHSQQDETPASGGALIYFAGWHRLLAEPGDQDGRRITAENGHGSVSERLRAPLARFGCRLLSNPASSPYRLARNAPRRRCRPQPARTCVLPASGPGPGTPAANSRAAVTLSRAAAAISAPPFPDHPAGIAPGRQTDTPGMHARAGGTPQAETRAWHARPWPSVESRRCTPTVKQPRRPSAICPWTPRHADIQRHKMTHAGTERKRPLAREFAASGAFPQVVAGVGFEPT
jgi:hypothetical protein